MSSYIGKGRPGALSSIQHRTLATDSASELNTPCQSSLLEPPSPRYQALDGRRIPYGLKQSTAKCTKSYARLLIGATILAVFILAVFANWTQSILHDSGTKFFVNSEHDESSRTIVDQREKLLPNIHVTELDPRPHPRLPSGDPTEKYMAYFPHSVSQLIPLRVSILGMSQI